jgi:hypothetical protein
MAEEVRVTPITVVASIDLELLNNLIDMEEIDADSVDDCTDEKDVEYLECTQERDAFVTAKFVKAKLLVKVSFTMSEKDSELRVFCRPNQLVVIVMSTGDLIRYFVTRAKASKPCQFAVIIRSTGIDSHTSESYFRSYK